MVCGVCWGVCEWPNSVVFGCMRVCVGERERERKRERARKRERGGREGERERERERRLSYVSVN